MADSYGKEAALMVKSHPDIYWRGLHIKQNCSDEEMVILQSEVGPSYGACVVVKHDPNGLTFFVAHVVAAEVEIRGYGANAVAALEAAYRKAEAFVERFKE